MGESRRVGVKKKEGKNRTATHRKRHRRTNSKEDCTGKAKKNRGRGKKQLNGSENCAVGGKIGCRLM